MPASPKTPPQQRSIRRAAFVTAFDEETPDHHSDLLATFKRPAKRTVKAKFSDEAKAALLNAMASHSWTTAREAYGWAWNELGLRVNYITVWRFLTAEGLLCGDTPRARRLRVVQQQPEAKVRSPFKVNGQVPAMDLSSLEEISGVHTAAQTD